jgi:hypothetical protein
MSRYGMTFELAHSAATDAANRQMRIAGRHAWNSDDSDKAAATFHKLQPCPSDVDCEFCGASVSGQKAGK